MPKKDEVLFGSYPQSYLKCRRRNKALNALVGELPTEGDHKNWTSYKFFVGGRIQHYMFYQDVEFEGKLYRGVYFTRFRNYWCKLDNDYSTYQDDNGYTPNNVYWFKFEPIKWKIVQQQDGLATLVSVAGLDSREFDYKLTCENNWQLSTLRQWLNDDFYGVAFSAEEKGAIVQTLVENGLHTTCYHIEVGLCSDTTDNVWLLSYQQAKSLFKNSKARQKHPTDYSQCLGCLKVTDDYPEFGTDCCWWWLRSPYYGKPDGVSHVIPCGNVHECHLGYDCAVGIAPAITVKLDAEQSAK